MASALWALKLMSKIVYTAGRITFGVMRSALRGVISLAVKMEESLPKIQETIKEIDPGQTYADWAQQYRSLSQGTDLEKKLAIWPRDIKIDSSVMTFQNHRRAVKYRYIFAANVVDDKMFTESWKMFSIYSNELLSPDEIIRKFEDEYYGSKYENNLHIKDIVIKRVQKWTKSGKK